LALQHAGFHLFGIRNRETPKDQAAAVDGNSLRITDDLRPSPSEPFPQQGSEPTVEVSSFPGGVLIERRSVL
jgi:hypothetical protein